MDTYTIGELSIAIVAVIGSIGSCCLIVERSRCKTIRCCGMVVEREVPPVKGEVDEEAPTNSN